MLVIRLQRTGRKNKATFRLVLQEKSQAPKSKAQEILGSYNPHLVERKDQIILKEERIKHWLSVGAQPSNTVHNMLLEFGVISGDKKRSVTGKGEEQPEEAPAEGGEATEGGEEAAASEEKSEEAPAEEKTEEAAE